MNTTVKLCRRCHIVKPAEAFPNHSGHSDGMQAWCKDCHREYRRENPKARARDARQARAYRRAEIRLREAHRDEFDRYYREELAK